jgi:hypothetical protein
VQGLGSSLDEVLRTLADTEAANAGVNTSDLAAALMRRFGGPDGLADRILEIVDDQDVPGGTKARVMADVLRLVTENTKQGQAQNAGSLTDEELLAELAPVLNRGGGVAGDPPAA